MADNQNNSDLQEDIKRDEEKSKNSPQSAMQNIDKAKGKADDVKKAQNTLNKITGGSGAKVATKVAIKLPTVITIVVVILLIIFTIGVILFFQNMPGQILGKVKKVASTIGAVVRSKINGEQADITSDEVVELAQYLENMGYNVEGYGFADVKYSEDEDKNSTYGVTTTSGKTREILSVTKDSHSKNYLKDYMAADEMTYFKATENAFGWFQALVDNFQNAMEGNDVTASSADYSTGLIEVDNTGHETWEKVVSIANVIPPVGLFNKTIGKGLVDPTKIDKTNHVLRIKGDKYNYNFALDGWTSKYGRPLELFLALHLSTMMPDLVDQIATDKAFNTKVHISFQYTNLYAEQINVTSDNGEEIHKEDIFDAYINYMIDCFETNLANDQNTLANAIATYSQQNNNPGNNNRSTAQTTITQDTIDDLREYVNDDEACLSALNKLIRGSDRVNTEEAILKEVKVNSKSKSLSQILNIVGLVSSKIPNPGPANTKLSGDNSTYLEGITDTQLNELTELYANLACGQEFYLPLITRVSKNWFWDGNKEEEEGTNEDANNNVYFTKSDNDNNLIGVYNTTKSAKKTVQFEPNDESSLKGFNITVNGLIINPDGFFYQVNEPYTVGPNPEIVALFKNKYYKYDGTDETARKIAISKKLDEETKNSSVAIDNEIEYYYKGEKTTVSDDEKTAYESKDGNELATKETPSFGSSKDTLSSFEILKNMDTEDSEVIYRMLKQLATSEKLKEVIGEGNVLKKSDVTQDLKQILLWPFDKVDGKTPGTVSKDVNKYGMIISDVNESDFLAPIDCDVTKVEGNKVTLKLGSLSEKAIDVLKFKYRDDFYNIDADLLNGWTMVIDGVSGATTGHVARGSKIGKATDKVTIVLQRLNKTIVGDENDTTEDNVETYMDKDYTLTDENDIEKHDIANKDAPKIDEEDFYDEASDSSYDVDAANVNVDEVKKEVYKLLTSDKVTDKPLNDKAACAIMAVIQAESGFRTTATNPNDAGYGLIQWTNGRRTNLETWLDANGYARNSVEGQLKYFFYELKNSYNREPYKVYDYIVNEDHTLDEYLLYYLGHDEFGYDYMPGTAVWTRPYHTTNNPKTPEQMYKERLAIAKGFYNNLSELKGTNSGSGNASK